MNKNLMKERIFWAPSVTTVRSIDDADTAAAIEVAQYRFNASMRDLETKFDEAASELRTEFLREVSSHVA